MHNILCQKNIPKNPYFFPAVSLCFSTAALLLGERAIANNSVLRSIFSCQAQGLGGATPTIKVWFKQGTNLNFIPTGETIKKVWLDDPSQVTLDFDGQLCPEFSPQSNNTENCENSGASVIHMRRIQKLNIPGLPHTDSTLLTVVTEGQGRRKLYTFQVDYGDDAPEYNTLAVYADPPSASGASCVRASNTSNNGGTLNYEEYTLPSDGGTPNYGDTPLKDGDTPKYEGTSPYDSDTQNYEDTSPYDSGTPNYDAIPNYKGIPPNYRGTLPTDKEKI